MSKPARSIVCAAALATIAACGSRATPAASPATTAVAPEPGASAEPDPRLRYPAAPRGELADDPYRWLEDDAPATTAWVEAENRLTDQVLDALPDRAALRDRLAAVHRYASTTAPIARGGRYFWLQRDGVRDQPVVVTAASLDGEPTVVLDFNELSAGGTRSFAGMVVSPDGTLVAYGLADGGGDWTRWHLRDVATGAELPEVFEHMKYYPPEFVDGGRVIYSRFPAPPPGEEIKAQDLGHAVYLHRLGTPVADDTIVYQRPDQPTWQFDPMTGRNRRYVVLSIGDGQVGDRSKEQIVVLDLAKPEAKPIVIADRFDDELIPIAGDGTTFYFLTDAGAPTRAVIAVDVRTPTKRTTIVAAGADPINGATLVGDELIVTTLHDVHAVSTRYDRRGKHLGTVPLPGLGTAFWMPTEAGSRDGFYVFSSFTTPGEVHRVDLATRADTAWRRPTLGFDPDRFTTTQHWFSAPDGTKVPMFVVGAKDLALDGSHPAIVTGYGFGGIPYLPRFDASMIPWLERGGIYVVVNLRGGGEFGDAWHRAASREKRQVGIDDFIAGCQALTALGYTTPARTGATGASGGGFLVAAALVQRPDVFGAVVPVVGVHDLLRFHLFGQGAGWQGDMGEPDDPVQRVALLKVSPLHNVRAGTAYPATLVLTSDHDVRVAPLHSYKFAAALQAAQAGADPTLLRVYTNTGHGASGLNAKLTQSADSLAFFARYLD